MRLVPLDSLVRHVRINAPAAPIPLAEQQLVLKAIELCERFPAWRETETIRFGENDPSEFVCSTPDAIIDQVETALFDGQPLEKVRPEILDQKYPDWMEDKEISSPRYITQIEINTVRIYPASAGTLTLRIVMKPTMDAVVLPSAIVNQYGPLLVKGAAGQILVMNDQELANPSLGSGLLSQFQRDLDTAATRAAKSQLRAPLRTKPRFM